MNHIRQHRLFICILAFLLILVGFVVAADAAVRVIYFVPNDRTVQPHIPSALDTQIKTVQTFYANQMEQHGYGRKTFDIETDGTGSLVVHQITGLFNDTYYHNDTLSKVHNEIRTYFDTETDVYAIFVDISTERVKGSCGITYFEGGPAMFPVNGECVTGDAGIDLIAHELGHAFNLEHDFRDDTDIMSYGHDRNKISACAAALLDVSPYFSLRPAAHNTPATIQLLSPLTYTHDLSDWSLQFSISDSDGIYQVEFLHAFPNNFAGIIGCQRLTNQQSEIIEFQMPVGASLSDINDIWIRTVDPNGYIQSQDWTLTADPPAGTDTNITYLTLSYDSHDALIPTNNMDEWDGWVGHIWEKTPDGNITPRPQYYLSHANSDVWDNWFYAHAPSRIVYDISSLNPSEFSGWLYIAHPCSENRPPASIEFICYADGSNIYNSGIKRGDMPNDRNTHITFDIPANTQTLTIEISTGTDGSTCDHFVVGNARLLFTDVPDPIPPPTTAYTDVNRDGSVNLVDLVIVASRYGEYITGDPIPNPDVNRDGVVDVNDLILVTNEMPIQSAPDTYPIQTQLLPNYPNPFNPETWIPYILSEPTDVAISIYAIDGRHIRQLDLGYQDVGLHINKQKAAYWDGRNEYGEPVASGVYFYMFTTDKFTAIQKMLIWK